MKLSELVRCSERVASTAARKEKIASLAACLRQLEPEERAIGVAYLSGELPQGRIGVGYAAVSKALAVAHHEQETLSLQGLDATFHELAGVRGRGSAGRRRDLLEALMARATAQEQRFIAALLVGELRQGALESLVLEAVAQASGVSSRAMRRAWMVAGELASVATAAFEGGEAALAALGPRLFRPLKPMLAQPGEHVAGALALLEDAIIEQKLDGVRIQVHKAGEQIRVYSRSLKEVTAAVPEVVEQVAALPAAELILDGEVLALRPDGSPHTFQTTMRRVGRKGGGHELRVSLPLSPFFFDCLWLEGESLLERSARERFATLEELLPASVSVRREAVRDLEHAQAFVDATLAAGHEGVMLKAAGASYAAGARGRAWLKVKPTHTLDLVVLAAEWGHGRRRGWLSNLHLGARAADGSFVMLGKTFKGMTDAVLRWQTEALQQIALGQERQVLHVRPELVVEVAFNDIQASPHYPSGLALRFARIKRYRSDKTAAEADTIETAQAIHSGAIAKARAAGE